MCNTVVYSYTMVLQKSLKQYTIVYTAIAPCLHAPLSTKWLKYMYNVHIFADNYAMPRINPFPILRFPPIKSNWLGFSEYIKDEHTVLL